ncbi:NUDIX domain-containing protein [Microbacterium azadirachtae]|uniref:ADP-ribose pyrophosphatase n=1 Tax=Microbacterium azadirachtae TaxID=582680 RepID=A0A1I6FNK1_9MICO|nr:NUDIX hydrolase [Microbacterium azadirachtae]SFR31522.1 ADP-ribose pyrophosphatase [Microbacterium azadirachtae]
MSDSGTAPQDETFEPEVLESREVYRGAVWSVREDRVRYGDGEIVRQYIDHSGAVAVVAMDEEGRVLLIQQYRHPIRERDWELPAGLLDVVGEDPMAAARRELAEEADLTASGWEPLVSTYTTPGSNSELIHIYLATGLAAAAEAYARTDEEADIRLAWVPLAEAADAVLAGRLRNGILAVGVLAAERRLSSGRARREA